MADEPLKPEPLASAAPPATGAIAAPPAPAAGPGAPAAPVPAPAPAAAPAEAAPQHPSEIPSLLEELVAPGAKPAEKEAAPAAAAEAPKPGEAQPKLGEAKPAAAAKPEAAKPGEAKPAEAAPAPAAPAAPTPIVVADLKLPEGFKAIPEQMESFATLLSAADLPPMERAQKLIDLHTTALKEYAIAYDKAATENQVRVFNEMRANWRNGVMADPELGGAGYQTAQGAVARMRDMFVSRAEYGSPQWNEHMKDFVDFLRTTGAGDHKAFHRILHNVARAFDEPGMPPPNPRPPPDVGKNPNKPNGLRDIYKSSANAQR